MFFLSLWFLLFLIISLPSYYLVKKQYRWIFLLISSVVFYLLCSYKSIIFLLFSSIIVYFSSLAINNNKIKEKDYILKCENAEEKKILKNKNKKIRKIYLISGLIMLVVILSMMKYMNFIIDNVNLLSSIFNVNFKLRGVKWLLPLGISFYTFQAIGYLVDVYWGKYDPEKNFLKFFLFMIFFPKIIQGPIIRYNDIHDTLFLGNDFNYENFTDGLKRMSWGYFKKMVIADLFIVVVNYGFDNISSLFFLESILCIIFYFIYDYCDFSGYMDISVGTAKCFGVDLPENFKRPYFARGIDEYWRRWHITLGTWFKDYVFYPLSVSKFSLKLGKKSKKIFGSFGKKIPGIFGLLIVWFITGLWHGASWNYVLWGLYFGFIIILGLIFEPLFNKMFSKINRENIVFRIIRHIRTLILLAFGKILFEMNSVSKTIQYIKTLFGYNGNIAVDIFSSVGTSSVLIALLASFIVLFVDIVQEKYPETTFIEKTKKLPLMVQWLIFIFLIVCIVWFGYYGSGLPRFEFGYMRF